MTNFSSKLSDRVILKISGRDKLEFLNSLLTNNLNKVKNSVIIYSLLLNPQGKYMHDMFIFSDRKGDFMIDLHQTGNEDFVKRLKFYQLRSEINIEEMTNYQIYNFSKIDEIMPRLNEKNENLYYFADPRLKEMGYRVYSPIKLELDNMIYRNYDLHRIKNGVAEGHKDLIYNKSLPLYFNLQYLNSIDYNKGCYVGQEIIARTTYRGVIRKFLIIIKSELEDQLNQDDIIYYDAEKIGHVASVMNNYALGLVGKFVPKISINNKLADSSLSEWSKKYFNENEEDFG